LNDREPEIIHQSEGLTIKRNKLNRFVVATLFYYADPAKRKPEWARTVRAGMTESQWRKEYEIDYLAQFGEKVFPELETKRDRIVVPSGNYDGIAFWGGFDYGARNPSSFHVYTYHDGVFYAIWELYKPCHNIPDFAKEIRSCPYYPRLKYIASDPTLFDKRTHSVDGTPESVANLFIKEGITKFIRGSQDETTWLATLRKHWEPDNPTFKITEDCPNMIREFERATFEDYSSDRMKQQKNTQEGVTDKDNHAMDDNKYFFNSQPATKANYLLKQATDKAAKWYGWGAKTKRGEFIDQGYTVNLNQHPRRKELQ